MIAPYVPPAIPPAQLVSRFPLEHGAGHVSLAVTGTVVDPWLVLVAVVCAVIGVGAVVFASVPIRMGGRVRRRHHRARRGLIVRGHR